MTRTLLASAALLAGLAGPAWSQAQPAPAQPRTGAAGTAADRDQEGRRHRQRLYLPQRQPSGDVHRHQGRRDRHRSGRLRPADRRPAICRRDQEGHRQADQIPDLQPPPLRPHRRRQGVQGRRRHHRRAQARQGAARPAEGPAHAAARRGVRQATRRSSSAAPRSSSTISASTTPTRRW